MSNTIRITSAGNYYANSFDEVTYNPNSGYNKNLLQYSQNFDQINSILSGWYGANSSSPYNAYILTNATKSPAGDSTGQKLLSAPAAAGSTIQRVYQNVNFVAGQAYTFSLYAKIAEFSNFISYVEPASGRVGITVNLSTLSVYVYAGATTNTFITPVGNGWYRVGFTWIAPATESATVDAMRLVNNSGQSTFTGDGISGIYIWGAQLELGSTATIYQATGNGLTPANNSVSKIDSNGNSYITGQFDEITYNANSGYQKNLLPYSQTGLANIWAPAAITYTANATIAPDGTKTAGLIQETSGLATHVFAENINLPTANTSYTFSCYIKSYSGDRQFWFQFHETPAYNYVTAITNNSLATFDSSPSLGGVANPSGGIYSNPTGSLVYVGNGWYRISLSVKVANQITNTTFVIGLYNVFAQSYVGNGTSGIYIWGPQVELGNTATIYVPTVSNSIIANTFVQRVVNTGDTYVSGSYDEWTGVVATTNGLVLNLDAAVPASYSGVQGSNWYDTASGYVFSYYSYLYQSTFNTSNSTFNMSSTLFEGFNSTTGTLPALDTSTFSIEVWLKPTNYNSNNQYNNMISFRETYATKGFRFGLSTTSGLNTDTAGAPIFWTNQTGGNFITSASSYPILINNWYQIVVTYDGTNCKIYVNGSLYSNTTGTYLPPSGNGLEIGGDGDGLLSFTGQLSNYKHYNRALSAQEVLNNFNGLRNRFGI